MRRTVILVSALILLLILAGWIYLKPTEEQEPRRPPAQTASVNPEPQPFDSIALASDTSYDSPPIPEGTAPGEVLELTALKIKFVWCPPGSFRMGSPIDSPGHTLNETLFDVTLTKGFWMQQTEVTQAQYKAIMGINPSVHPDDESKPVETVSWNDANEFCRRLSELPPEKSSGNLFRLPSEAEWEYACRAGSTTAFYFGDDVLQVEEYGWFRNNSNRTTHPVGQKKPNDWGLYDMHGNVTEWCLDYYGDYPTGPVTDYGEDRRTERPAQATSTSDTNAQLTESRCLRGGRMNGLPTRGRSAFRDAYPATSQYFALGFRLVAEPVRDESTPESTDEPAPESTTESTDESTDE